jgi:hypothetical protein
MVELAASSTSRGALCSFSSLPDSALPFSVRCTIAVGSMPVLQRSAMALTILACTQATSEKGRSRPDARATSPSLSHCRDPSLSMPRWPSRGPGPSRLLQIPPGSPAPAAGPPSEVRMGSRSSSSISTHAWPRGMHGMHACTRVHLVPQQHTTPRHSPVHATPHASIRAQATTTAPRPPSWLRSRRSSTCRCPCCSGSSSCRPCCSQ